ncbi:hypothetical protein Q8A67_008128 [Cirrhinus molitorella]|uniref:Uncharacterized protein n=1 Tax=Cirrhinus molitorella TaxID=172907 RepID=A0AA88TSH7_9TELE|nr:hypothetical protein Q8A67_008128 [Cirrhinus molitorella]
MATICKICVGPIEPPDQHDHCVACLGLVHAEAALDDSSCGHCADLPARVLRAHRDVALWGEARCRQRAAGGPPLSRWREHRLATSPASAVTPFPADGEIQIFFGAWSFLSEGQPPTSDRGGDCYCPSPGARCQEESMGSREEAPRPAEEPATRLSPAAGY